MLRYAFLPSVACLILSGCATDDSGPSRPPDYLVLSYGGGVTTAGLPRTSLLDDPANQLILRACVPGTGLAELTRLKVDSLEERVRRLCDGRVLLCEDSAYRPGLPLFTGADRERLDSIAGVYAGRLVEPVSGMLREMRSSGDVTPDNQFHVLWSLVIDQTWYSIWERLCPAETGPPQVSWIVDPPHDYLVGTNYWQLLGGSIVSATWGPHCDEHLGQLTPLRLEILRAAWDVPGNDSVGEATLRRYGFLADDGTYLGLTYRDSAALVERLSAWRNAYSDDVARISDLRAASMILGVPENQVLVILLHEVAYALFQRLAEGHVLEFPQALVTGGPVDRIVDLVSVRLVRRPLPEDMAMAVFMANEWHGTEEVVPLFRQVLEANPNDLQTRLLLGMSLYDVKRYDEAVVEFEDLSRRSANDPETKRLFDWSRIWLGHVSDAKGERAKAIAWYQAVVDNGSAESRMSFGQYRISMTNAVAWARERLKTPFDWR